MVAGRPTPARCVTGRTSHGSLTIDDHYLIFDVKANSFTVAGGLDRIAFQTATTLANGAVFVVGGVGIAHQFPTTGALYTPEQTTLHIRFHGDGAGVVSVRPGTSSCAGSADVQLAAGLHVHLRAQASGGWTLIHDPLPRVPAGVPGRPRPVRFKHNVFDGWGMANTRDMTNPLSVYMQGDQTVDVNFNLHIGEMVPPRFPPIR